MAAIYVWPGFAPIFGPCGFIAPSAQGNLLSPTPIQQVNVRAHTIEQPTPFVDETSFNNTKVICFTVVFCREFPAQGGQPATMIDLIDGSSSQHKFRVYMGSTGFVYIEGRNSSDTLILSVAISNNGGSWAGGALHGLAVVIDLADVTKREIRMDNVDITDNAAYVTWITYTNDTIDIVDTGAAPNECDYGFGIDMVAARAYGVGGGGTGFAAGLDSLGFLSFDDSCSLVPKALWSVDGWYRDPGKWEGWYITQPQVFFGPSFYRNTGKTEPATYNESVNFEKTFSATTDAYGTPGDHLLQDPATIINNGIGAKITP